MHMANTSKYTPSLRTKSSDIFFVSSLYLEIMTKLKVLNKIKVVAVFLSLSVLNEDRATALESLLFPAWVRALYLFIFLSLIRFFSERKRGRGIYKRSLLH